MSTDNARQGPRGPHADRGRQLFRSNLAPGGRVIAGVTQDNTGAVLGGCTVDLFIVGTNQWLAQVVSDPVTGVYSFPIGNDGTLYFVRCFKEGTPVFGTSDNTLTGLAP